MTKTMEKKGYKETKLGMIPEDWEIKKLDKISKIVDSLHETPKFAVEGYPMVRVTDIKMGNLDLSNASKVSEKTYKEFTRNHIPKRGNIVLSRVGSYGISSYVNTDSAFCIGQNTVIIVPLINNLFLYQIIQSNSIRAQINLKVGGSSQKTISLKSIRELLSPIPPLTEQQKIAEILSTVDEKIDHIDKQIKQTEQLKKGLMQQLLTKGIGHTEFKDTEIGRIPKSWEVKKLGDLVDLNYGKSPKEILDKNGKYSVLGTSKAENRKGNDYLFKGKSIIIGRKGTIDKPYYINEPFWAIDTTYYTTDIIENNTLWLYYFILNLNLKSLNEATGVPSLNREVLKNINIPHLSLREQNEIAEIITTSDEKLKTLQNKKSGYEKLKKGLMQKLLTGQIRVRV